MPDVHVAVEQSSTGRMHELSRDCWCHPDVDKSMPGFTHVIHGPAIDTANHLMVGVRGDFIVVGAFHAAAELTLERALNLAAWLVALADPTNVRFPFVLEAVKNT
jgi:hypothetical protein